MVGCAELTSRWFRRCLFFSTRGAIPGSGRSVFLTTYVSNLCEFILQYETTRSRSKEFYDVTSACSSLIGPLFFDGELSTPITRSSNFPPRTLSSKFSPSMIRLLATLKQAIGRVEAKAKVMRATVTPLLNTEWNDLENRIQESKTAATSLGNDYMDSKSRLDDVRKENKTLTGKVASQDKTMTTQAETISTLTGKVDSQDKTMTTQAETITTLTGKVDSQDKTMTTQAETITTLTGKVDSQTKTMATQAKTMATQAKTITTLTTDVERLKDREKLLTVRQVAKCFEDRFMFQLDGGKWVPGKRVSGGWTRRKFIEACDTYQFLKEPAKVNRPGRMVDTGKWDIQAKNEFMGRFESALRRDFPKRDRDFVKFSRWLSIELQWAKDSALNVAHDPTPTQADVKAILVEKSPGWTYLGGNSVALRQKLWQDLHVGVATLQKELGMKKFLQNM
jgi:hypothetical protein